MPGFPPMKLQNLKKPPTTGEAYSYWYNQMPKNISRIKYDLAIWQVECCKAWRLGTEMKRDMRGDSDRELDRIKSS